MRLLAAMFWMGKEGEKNELMAEESRIKTMKISLKKRATIVVYCGQK